MSPAADTRRPENMALLYQEVLTAIERLRAVADVDLVYNLAADMGGMGFIENNKALCMLSVLINTHLLMAVKDAGAGRYFYASSACVYAADKQTDPDVTALKEEDAYPALPEDGYGWEKLFAEELCRYYYKDYGFETRIVRFHNVYGPLGTYDGGKEKAPAAISRKVALARNNDEIEVWGDGEQTRSFMYVDDCVEGLTRIMASDCRDALNLGTDELVTINRLVDMVAGIARKRITKRHNLTGPQGVRGRNSDNTRLRKELGWEPSILLQQGLAVTYAWINSQVRQSSRKEETVGAD